MDSKGCFVYWLHRPSDSDVFTQGYVGISTNPVARFKAHRYTAKTNLRNHKLYNAMRAYDDFEMTLLIKTDVNYCLDIEFKLRPEKNVGLNAAPGGRTTMMGRLNYNYSEQLSVKEKISKGVKLAHKNNPGLAENIRKSNTGRIRSEEVKAKLRASSASRKSQMIMWNNSIADSGIWELADIVYLLYNEKKSLSGYELGQIFGYLPHAFQSVIKAVRSGWNPLEDTNYLKFKEQKWQS